MGENTELKDVQGLPDDRDIVIDMVGVREVEWPIKLKDRVNEIQYTNAKFAMYVRLPKEQKGTHMSRFVEALVTFSNNDEFFSMDVMADKMSPYIAKDLNAEFVHIECEFTYFLDVLSPETKIRSKLPVKVCFIIEYHSQSQLKHKGLEVKVPVTTLCPCSKEMSETPHNQRGIITMQIQANDFLWIEELVEIASKSCSCPIFPLLKRPDEKFVMDVAGENPMFVEDVVREVAIRLKRDKRILSFTVGCENMESIHPHNAFATVDWERDDSP